MKRIVNNLFKTRYRPWINGKEVLCNEKVHKIYCPATEKVLCEVDETSEHYVKEAVYAAKNSFENGIWSKKDSIERAEILERISRLLKEQVDDIALKESYQTGRAIREMKAQLNRLPEWLDYFAALAKTQEGTVPPFKGSYLNYVTRAPLGIIGQITPFNHPMLIAIKKISVALATGNSIVLKPPDTAPCSIIEFAKICQDAGLPDGVFNVIPGLGSTTGKWLVENPYLNKIDFTGGTETGRKIGKAAGSNIASICSELGGKTPIIVFEDANIKQAINGVCFASFIASGQTCVTGSRLLVQETIYDLFISKLVEKTRTIKLGPPQDLTTQMGPVNSENQKKKILNMIKEAKEEGGIILCGGHSPSEYRIGHYIEPTIIACSPHSKISREEVFGPVLSVMPFKNEFDAINLVNNSKYGLAAAIWSKSVSCCHRVADALDVGLIWINDHHRNDPSSPWGGMKDSGLGRENGLEAFREYTQTKSVVVNTSDSHFDWFKENSESRYG